MLSRRATPTSNERAPASLATMTGQLLHANESALGWVRLLASEDLPQSSMPPSAPLPRSLEEFPQRMLIQPEKQIVADQWTQFEMRQSYARRIESSSCAASAFPTRLA